MKTTHTQKTKDELVSRFDSKYLFSDLELTSYKIIGNDVIFEFRLGDYHFAEIDSFSLDFNRAPSLAQEKLVLMLGITKAFKYTQHFLTPKFVIHNSCLEDMEEKFWQNYFTQYSMELFFSEKIDPKFLVNLEFLKSKKNINRMLGDLAQDNEKYLLGVGGGKDAIFAHELLVQSGKNVDLFYSYLNEKDQYLRERLSNKMHESHACEVFSAQRESTTSDLLASEISLQKKIGIKPSAPAASVNALRMALVSLEFGYKYIVTANEKSADTGIAEYHGCVVNHQYSKSFEFEKQLQDLIRSISKDTIVYFSCLKPYYEINIAKGVSQLNQYFGSFTSCNRDTNWCMDCSKCAFVFSLFAAFIGPEKLGEYFPINLFEKESLRKDFLELMGLEGHRPFECVGDPNEMNLSLYFAKKLGHRGYVIDMFEERVLPSFDHKAQSTKHFHIYLESGQHCIPQEVLDSVEWSFFE